MTFKEKHIYHIYNQGNNRQKIFFKRENYLYFFQKIRTYILPYGDVLACYLMPKHFHLMVFINTVGVALSDTDGNTRVRSFNDSIGIMLRSYTNAINKQENRTGKLFREGTKAVCVNCPDSEVPSFMRINGIYTDLNPDGSKDYPQTCRFERNLRKNNKR